MPAAFDESRYSPDLDVVRRSASRWRWVLALTVLVMVSLTWATWFEITMHERRRAMDAAARRQSNLAIAVGQYLTRALGNADAVAQYLAGAHASPATDLAEQLAGRARANTLFTDMSICFEGGALLSAGSAASGPQRAQWCTAWLREAPPGARTFAGQPVRAAGETLVPLLTRVPAADRPAGVIALLVDVRNLLGVMQEYIIPDDTVVTVAGPDHRVRARWHSATRMADQGAPETALLPAALAAGRPGQLHEVAGVPVLATPRAVPPYPLTVLIVTSVADTLAEPRQRSWYYGVAGSIATLLIVVFALLLLRLQNQALRTAESLGRARLRLQALNDELEDQVQVRTGELESACRDLEAFSYTVAHDVRAPIAAIQGFAQALAPAVEATGDPRSSHYLARIVANATQMNQLTESLLSLGKLSRPQMAETPLDLSAMAREVLAGLRERDGTRVVETSVQDGLWVHGDAVLLRQVLENLLGNAWKFSAARSPAVIRVTGERDGEGWLTVAIDDNGDGFDSDSAEGLFTPFRRMHAAGEFPGTGVGLATVERILRLHGGRTWIESSPAEGTTVYFRMRAVSA